MSQYAPRPYQTEAINALTASWTPEKNRLAVVLPTGAGKTVVFSNLINTLDAAEQIPGRVLVIAHREELIQQAADKIRAVVPGRTVGIVKAERNEHYADVIVASVQTLAVERRRRAIDNISLVIVDECHHAAAPTYIEVLEHFGAWRGVPVAGFTATLTRADGGLADVWQEVVYRMDVLDLIRAGHLVDVTGKRVVVGDLNLDKVKTRGGDLQEGQLGQALEESSAAAVVADAYGQFAGDRPGVVFTPTVASAKAMATAMNSAGFATGVVYGDMPREERRATLAAYTAGDLQVLANCMVLTEGFDAPHTSCAVIARPTKSPGLYVQMAGRALRLSPETGKTNALILDVMGASTRHKLASLVDLSEKGIKAPKEGQSLREAADDVEDIPAAAPPVLRWEDIELFGQSSVRWLQTADGTWFVQAAGVLLFLVPDPAEDGYRMRKWEDGAIIAPGRDLAFDLRDAMRYVEAHARSYTGGRLLARDARWREGPPSDKQTAYCRYHRIPVPRGASAGEVSDLQAIHSASLRIRESLGVAA